MSGEAGVEETADAVQAVANGQPAAEPVEQPSPVSETPLQDAQTIEGGEATADQAQTAGRDAQQATPEPVEKRSSRRRGSDGKEERKDKERRSEKEKERKGDKEERRDSDRRRRDGDGKSEKKSEKDKKKKRDDSRDRRGSSRRDGSRDRRRRSASRHKSSRSRHRSRSKSRSKSRDHRSRRRRSPTPPRCFSSNHVGPVSSRSRALCLTQSAIGRLRCPGGRPKYSCTANINLPQQI